MDDGVRVPAVVIWPSVTEPGSQSDVRLQSTDLYPTILRMLNVERLKDHVIDGVDFAKALRGEEMDRGPMFESRSYAKLVSTGRWEGVRH